MELLILWQYARVIVTTPYWFSYFYILRNASINDIKGEIFRNLIEVIAFLIVCHKFSFNIISNHDSMNFIIWWNFVINFLEIFDVNSGLHFVSSYFVQNTNLFHNLTHMTVYDSWIVFKNTYLKSSSIW